MVRQVSLPDINELAELWGDLPDEFALDLDPLKDGALPMGSLLPGLTGQMSLGLIRQGSIARLAFFPSSATHSLLWQLNGWPSEHRALCTSFA